MIDIKNPKCVLCKDKKFSNPKYEGYCLNCFLHTFPDKPVTRNYKTKEKSVVDYIKQQFPYLDIVWDKSIKDGVRDEFLYCRSMPAFQKNDNNRVVS